MQNIVLTRVMLRPKAGVVTRCVSVLVLVLVSLPVSIRRFQADDGRLMVSGHPLHTDMVVSAATVQLIE